MVEGNKEIKEILDKIENLTVWDKKDFLELLISKYDDLSFLNDYIDWDEIPNRDIIDEVEKRNLYAEIIDNETIINAINNDDYLMEEVLEYINNKDLHQIFDKFGCEKMFDDLSEYFDTEFDDCLIKYLKNKLKKADG